MMEWLEEVYDQMEAGSAIVDEVQEKMEKLPILRTFLNIYKVGFMGILYGHVVTFWVAYYMGLFK